VRLTLRISQKHKFAAYLDRIVSSGDMMPRALGRGGVRHPHPEAILHGTGQVHGDTHQSAAALEAGWSENDETYSTGEVQRSVGVTDVARYDPDHDTRGARTARGRRAG